MRIVQDDLNEKNNHSTKLKLKEQELTSYMYEAVKTTKKASSLYFSASLRQMYRWSTR